MEAAKGIAKESEDTLKQKEIDFYSKYLDKLESYLIIWSRFKAEGDNYSRLTSSLLGTLSDELKSAAARKLKRPLAGERVFASLIPGTSNGDNSDVDLEMEIDRAVEALPYLFRRVLKKEYCSHGTRERKSKQLDISVRTYKDYLRVARYMLISYFVGKNVFK